jgi:hypothetical protein
MATAKKSLAETHPALAKEAHGWDPSKVAASDKQNYEWKCSLWHVWSATPNNRVTKGSGCHYCGNKKVLKGFNDLGTKFPELAMQADGWDPSTVVAGSKYIKDWKCSEGHSWQAAISNRTQNSTGCPFCSNHRVWPGFNDLLTKFPKIAQQAHGWDPFQTHSGGKLHKEWKCKEGHIWDAQIGQRTLSGNGCPVCSNSLLQKGINDLATTHPEIAQQAHGWDPTSVVAGSEYKAVWKCKLGHVWSARVYSITSSRTSSHGGCPVCTGKVIQVGFNDLATTYPELAKEAYGWDPRTVSKGSSKRKEWICAQKHLWETTVTTRASRNRGCPICSGTKVLVGFNDLATTDPELAKEAYGWDPKDLSKGSGKSRSWKCILGHIWEATIAARSGLGSGCPYCAGQKIIPGETDLATTHPEIAKEAFGWDPSMTSKGNIKKLNWKCPIGHVYDTSPNSRTSAGHACPYCSGHRLLTGFNDLATLHPELAKEAYGWDPTKYGHGVKYRATWKCGVGHEYVAPIVQRTFNKTGCPICSGRTVLAGFNDLLTTHLEIASQAVGWDPSKVNAGSNKKLRWRCIEGHEWITQPNDRVGGGKGCPTCAKAGFDPNQDGYLYFISHSDWEMLQIGITNNPDKRVGTHIKFGWEVIEIRGPMDGHLTQQWETAMLRMLKAKGADLSNAMIAGKFDGYTEAWSVTTFPVKSIKELMRMVEADEDHG